MRLDELPKSARIEDRRGVTVARGGIGIGTVVVLALIGWALGIDPRALIGGAEMLLGGGEQQQTSAGSTTSSGSPSDAMGHFVSAIFGSTETVWTDIFAQAGRTGAGVVIGPKQHDLEPQLGLSFGCEASGPSKAARVAACQTSPYQLVSASHWPLRPAFECFCRCSL